MYFARYNDQVLFNWYINIGFLKRKIPTDIHPISRLLAQQMIAMDEEQLENYHRKISNGQNFFQHSLQRESLEAFSLNRSLKGKRIFVHAIHPKFISFLIPLFKNEIHKVVFIDSPYFVSPIASIISKYALRSIKVEEALKTISFDNVIIDAGGRFVSMLHNYIAFFQKQKIDMVISVEGNSPHDAIVSLIADSLGIECLSVQHGWSPIIHNGFRDLHYSKMLVWGDIYGKMLSAFNPNLSFGLIENPSLKQLLPVGRKKKDVNGIVFFLQTKTWFITEAIWNSFISLIEECAIKFPERKIIVREHPAYPLTIEEKQKIVKSNVIFADSEKFSLSEIFEISNLSISIYSSTILESVSAGIFTIIYNETALPKYYPDLDRLGLAKEVKTKDECVDAIEMFYRSDSVFDSFKKKRNIYLESLVFRN